MARRSYAGATTIAAGATTPIAVTAGDRLIVYVSAPCVLSWIDGPGGTAGAFFTATGPNYLWPLTVPELVQQLQIVAGGGSPVVVRIAYND